MKIEIANKIETMIRNEEKHFDWLQSNNAPQEFIELSRWHIVAYAERLKEYRESLNLNNMESKKVTLNNGTVLEVGKKYIEPKWSTQQYILIDCFSTCGEHFLERFKDGSIGIGHVSTCTYLPYTEPTPQKEWKTFLIETLSQKTDVPYRFFSQYYSMEDAREHHKRAISIMEVKLNIEPVNS